jgi:2-isopropylmalate synthase
VIDPTIAGKIELVHRMEALGIQRVNVGLPAASARNLEDCVALCREIDRSRLAIRPVAAGRTVVSDVLCVADVCARTGLALEVYAFIGSSPIRQLVEAWDLAFLVRQTAQAVAAGVREGLSVCFVTEDTTRARPETLRALWAAAIEAGATRLCLTDTVGHATPNGVQNLVRFARDILAQIGASESVGIDWHGHDDRGLALDGALTALEAGADRIHATALGIGERCGNTAMERLLLNLMLLGELQVERAALARYCETAARALAWNQELAARAIGMCSGSSAA